MPKFILNREYRLFEEDKRSTVLLLTAGASGIRARASLTPSARAKFNAIEIDFDDCLIKGAAAKGKRISNRPVRRVTDITGAPRKTPPALPSLPGLTGGDKNEDA